MIELPQAFIDFMRQTKLICENESGQCLFLRVDDETLNTIKSDKEVLTKPESYSRLFFTKGENIHIIGLYLKNKFSILQGMKKLIAQEHPKSISWWNKTMTKFNYKEGLCHQHL